MEERIVYLDTNVLLNFYRYPFNVTEIILDTIETTFGNSLVVPERVCFEFNKNKQVWLKSKKQPTVFSQIKKEIDDQKDVLNKSLKSLKRINEINRLATKYDSFISKLEKEVAIAFESIDNELSSYSKDYTAQYSENDIVSSFVETHKSSVKTSIKEMLRIATIYEARVANGIGPGLTDAKKVPDEGDPFRRLGDYLVWNEILEHSSKFKKVIFVTNEKKKDYWKDSSKLQFNDFLLAEFNEKMNGTATFEPLLFDSFLKEYICDSLGEHPQILGFIEEQANIYKQIFEDKDFLYLCETDIYVIVNDLDEHLGDSISYSNIDAFDEVDIEALLIDHKNATLEYDYSNQEIIAQFPMELQGTLSVTADNGHIDGEYLYEYYTAKFERKVEVEAIYSFDGKLVKFKSFSRFKESYWRLYDECNTNYYDDCYNVCPRCGEYISSDNDAGDGFCTKCASEMD